MSWAGADNQLQERGQPHRGHASLLVSGGVKLPFTTILCLPRLPHRDDNSQELVAHVLVQEAGAAAATGGAGSEQELAGLDLHALASADLPEHPAAVVLGVLAGSAAEGGPSKESSTQWETPRDTLLSPGLSPMPTGR